VEGLSKACSSRDTMCDMSEAGAAREMGLLLSEDFSVLSALLGLLEASVGLASPASVPVPVIVWQQRVKALNIEEGVGPLEGSLARHHFHPSVSSCKLANC